MLLYKLAILGTATGLFISPPGVCGQTTLPGPQRLPDCEIVARIDGQIVQACEVLWQVNLILEDNRDRIPPDGLDDARRMIMQQQIAKLTDTKLIYSEFARSVPPENQQNVDEKLRVPFESEELPRLMKQLEVETITQLEQKLFTLGSSLDDVRRTFKERTIAGVWLRQNIKFNQEVTHDEMLQYYRDHIGQYEFSRQVRWEELAVRKNHFNHPDQAHDALVQMGNDAYVNAVQKGLRGPIFTEIAKARSHGFTAAQGGQHDWTTEGALRAPQVNDALFTLEVGQLSPILDSETSYHIVRVLERKEAGRTPFTEVQSEIRERIKEQRFNAAVEEYLVGLRERARIWTVYTGDTTYEMLVRGPAESIQR
jgi:parvulin-like peptidyl-prolyl isomerase